MFYNNAKNEAIKLLKNKETEYNRLGSQANDYALKLFEVRKSAVLAIERIEKYINALANSPKEFAKQIADVKLSIKEFNEAIKIEKENASNNIKSESLFYFIKCKCSLLTFIFRRCAIDEFNVSTVI